MGMRVEEDGRSESHAVMAWIGIKILSQRESVQTSVWCLITREFGNPTKGSKAEDDSNDY